MKFWDILRLGRITAATAGVVILTTSACNAQLSGSKISIHLIYNYTSEAQQIVNAKPRVFKVLDLHTSMIAAMRDYKQKAPDGKLVLRIYTPVQYNINQNPTACADDYWNNWLKPPLNNLSASDKALIDYLEGPNEADTTPYFFTNADAEWYNTFWMRLADLMHQNGYKPCAYNISVGNPAGNITDIQQRLDRIVPSLRKIRDYGGVWSYHSYTIQYTKNVGTEIWYSLRYRQYYNYFATAYPDLANMPMILTEGGVDGQVSPVGPGWKGGGDAAKYQDWLQWFDSEIKKDSYILGVTLFQSGDPAGWNSFEIEPIGSWLATYIASAAGSPIVTTTPGAFTFSSVANYSPLPQTLQVKNSGVGTMSYTLAPSANWINVSPASGSANGGDPNGMSHTVSVNPALAPYGSHLGNIQITSPGSLNSPTTVGITFNKQTPIVTGRKNVNVVRSAPENTPVYFPHKIITADFSGEGYYYMQDLDRSGGMRLVASPLAVAVGDIINVTGNLTSRIVSGKILERQLTVSNISNVTKVATVQPAKPLGMNIRTVGGQNWGNTNLNPGIDGANGLYNIGLLVRASGRVTSVAGDIATIHSDYPVDSGSPQSVVIKLPAGAPVTIGNLITVTGVVEGYSSMGYTKNQRYIRARTAQDVVIQ